MNRDDVLAVLRTFKRDYAEQYGILEIGVFGSIARNEQREDSDVDVVVTMQRPDLFTMVHIKDALEEALHLKVDIVRYREGMNQFLKKRIDQEAVYV